MKNRTLYLLPVYIVTLYSCKLVPKSGDRLDSRGGMENGGSLKSGARSESGGSLESGGRLESEAGRRVETG